MFSFNFYFIHFLKNAFLYLAAQNVCVCWIPITNSIRSCFEMKINNEKKIEHEK